MSEATAERAMRAVLEIEAAQKLEAVQQAVRSFARPYGYDRFVLFSAASASEEVVERIYWVEGDWFGDGRGGCPDLCSSLPDHAPCHGCSFARSVPIVAPPESLGSPAAPCLPWVCFPLGWPW